MEVEMGEKKSTYYLPIFYDILLTIGVPLNILFFAGVLLNRERISGGAALVMYILLAFLYWTAVVCMGVGNILLSFWKYRKGEDRYCVNAMLILKYGLVIFFIVNFLTLSMFGLAALVASRGTIIIMFPLVLPVVVFCVGVTWLIMLPGSFYGIQVVRFTAAQGKFSGGRQSPVPPGPDGKVMLHGILQVIFLVDILDAMYLAVMKWGMGKKSSVLVGALYAAFLAGTLILIFVIAG